MRNITLNIPGLWSPAVREATWRLVLVDLISDTCAAMDVLLGLDVVSAVITRQVVPLGSGLPATVGTKFGFVIMGSAPTTLCCSLSCGHALTLITPDAVCAYQLHAAYHQIPVAICVALTALLIPL